MTQHNVLNDSQKSSGSHRQLKEIAYKLEILSQVLKITINAV